MSNSLVQKSLDILDSEKVAKQGKSYLQGLILKFHFKCNNQ